MSCLLFAVFGLLRVVWTGSTSFRRGRIWVFIDGGALLFHGIEHAHVIHRENILADQIESLFHGLVFCAAVALHLGADQNEFRTFRNVFSDMSVLFTVDIESIPGLVPEQTEPVELIHGEVATPGTWRVVKRIGTKYWLEKEDGSQGFVLLKLED